MSAAPVTAPPPPPPESGTESPEDLCVRLEQTANTLVELTRSGSGKKLMFPIMECVKELRVVWSSLRTFALVFDANRVEAMQERERELRQAMDILNGTVGSLSQANEKTAADVDEHLSALDQIEGAQDPSFIVSRIRSVGGGVRHAATEMKGSLARSAASLDTSGQIIEAVDRKLAEASRQVMHDSLTRVLSRVAFERRVAEMAAQPAAVAGSWCVAVADIDRLGALNDKLGRRVGDALLFRIAEIIQKTCDTFPGALVGRYGGEEFGLLLPRCSLREGRHLAEEIRAAVEAAKWECKTKAGPGLVSATVSVGLTEHRDGEPPSHMLQRAERCAEQAKRLGRNRVAAEG